MDKINQLTVNGESYVLSDPETAKGLSQEISNRQAADETVLQTAKNYTDTATAELPTKEYVDSGLNTVHSNAMKAVNILSGRVDALEADYRHIATYEHTADAGVKQIDITKDKDGNAFSCSDFLIFLTLPTNADIADYKTQLYIGHKLYEWEVYMPQGFSTTATRRMRLHLYHAFDGYWVTDGVYNDNASQADYFVPNINGTNSGFGNLKSQVAHSKTIDQLIFVAQVTFGKGTKIEIYGK